MDEVYVTYGDDETFDNHGYDDVTDDDHKTAKAHFIRVFEAGTCRGHKPIIDQSSEAVILFSR